MNTQDPLRELREYLTDRGAKRESKKRPQSRLRREDRGTASSIGTVVFMAFLVTSAGVVHAVSLDKVEQEADTGVIIEEAAVTVLDQDKIRVVPLIGSDLNTNRTTVRVSFPDSAKTPFEIQNIGEATRRSKTTERMDVWYVKSGTKQVPVYKNIKKNYYELREERQYAGTRSVQRSTPIYEWSKTELTRVPVFSWEKSVTRTSSKIGRHRPETGYVRGAKVGTVRVRTGYETRQVFDHYDYSRKRVKDGLGWKQIKVGSYPTTKKVFTGYKRVAEYKWSWSRGLYKDYSLKRQYRYKTVWKPIYATKPYQKYKWQIKKKPVYKTVREPTYTHYPKYRWTKTVQYTKSEVSRTSPGAGWRKTGVDHYATKQKRYTTRSTTSPGAEWTRGDRTGTHRYTVEKPVYKTVTKRVLVDSEVERVVDHYKTVPKYRVVTKASKEMAFDDTVEELTTESDGGKLTGLERARTVSAGRGVPFLSFLQGKDSQKMPARASDVVSGVGGSIGSASPSAWGNGESFVIDLAEDVIEQDDLVRIQVFDTEKGQIAIDRTVRASNLPSTRFATQTPVANPPTGGSTTTLVREIVDEKGSSPAGWSARTGTTHTNLPYRSGSVSESIVSGQDSPVAPATAGSSGRGERRGTSFWEVPSSPPTGGSGSTTDLPSPIDLRLPLQKQTTDAETSGRLQKQTTDAVTEAIDDPQKWSVRMPYYTLRVDRDSPRVEVEWGSPWNPVELSEDDGSMHGYVLGRSHDVYDWMNEHGANLDETPIVSDFADHLANDPSDGTIVNSFLEGGEWTAERLTGTDQSLLGRDRYRGPDSHVEAETPSHTNDATVSTVIDVVTDSTKKVALDSWEYGSKTAGAVTSGQVALVGNGKSSITAGPSRFDTPDVSEVEPSTRRTTPEFDSVEPAPSRTTKQSGFDALLSGTTKILDELQHIGGGSSESSETGSSQQAEKPQKTVTDRVAESVNKAAKKGSNLLKRWTPW